jgi:hypothetical protein
MIWSAAIVRMGWKLRTNDLSVHYLVHYVFQSVCGVQSSEQASPNALSSRLCDRSPLSFYFVRHAARRHSKKKRKAANDRRTPKLSSSAF